MGETFLFFAGVWPLGRLPRSGRLAALPARGIGPPGAPGVNAGPRGPAPCQGTTGTMGEEADLMELGLAVSRLARGCVV